MMAGDKNSKDSGTDINKNEPPLIFSSFRLSKLFSCLFTKTILLVCLEVKIHHFFFKTTTLFFLYVVVVVLTKIIISIFIIVRCAISFIYILGNWSPEIIF